MVENKKEREVQIEIMLENEPDSTKKPVKIKKINDLKDIIKDAGSGNKSAIKKLIKPFLAPNEELVLYGISGEYGILIKTYNFYFLTDQRVGDLSVTPFTGELNMEVAFLEQIKSYTIAQPYISLIFRLFIWGSYLFLIGFLTNSTMKRVYLKYKKSGLYIKFGDFGGTYIFFDRERFNVLANLTNIMNDTRKKMKA